MKTLAEILKKAEGQFCPVVPFTSQKDKLLALDFTAANHELNDTILNDTVLFCRCIEEKLDKAGALYGIGGYAEHRTVYSRSQVFDATEGEEPRRLHLGTDIWGREGTIVMAPLEGTVHSFAFNDRYGDYGTTIILSHSIEDRIFYILYGHLSLRSINELVAGKVIQKGEVFAELGNPSENGHWPPHLHFQVVEKTGEWKGDYPGVCAFSQKEKYLANSPDPDLILGLNQYL
jgi:murein DD-endopeptidase MepM/ murein hydrolase activator NlpD